MTKHKEFLCSLCQRSTASQADLAMEGDGPCIDCCAGEIEENFVPAMTPGLLERRKVYHQAIVKWGRPAQVAMLAEEAAELAAVALQFLRGRDDDDGIMRLIDELADTRIMIEQIEYMLTMRRPVQIHMKSKIERLKRRLQ
jgi:hypothetical protein